MTGTKINKSDKDTNELSTQNNVTYRGQLAIGVVGGRNIQRYE